MPLDIFELARQKYQAEQQKLMEKETASDGAPSSAAAASKRDIVDASAESVVLLCGSVGCGKSELLRRLLSSDSVTQSSLDQVLRQQAGGGGADTSGQGEKTIALE